MRNSARVLIATGLSVICASPALADAKADSASVDSVADAPEQAAGGPAGSLASESGWQVSAEPYFWLAGLKGDIGVVPAIEPVDADLSFGDIFNALKFALMGKIEARNGRFVVSGDLLFMSLGADDDIRIRNADFVTVELGTKTLSATLAAGYRAVDRDRLFLDLLAGGRLNSVKVALDLTGPRRSFSGDSSETWLDPVVGARLQAPLAKNWSLQTYGDIGGFGIGSELTWQLSGVVRHDLGRRWSLWAGWRHLKTDYEQDGFVFDVAMDGPILGAAYRF